MTIERGRLLFFSFIRKNEDVLSLSFVAME